MTMTIGISPHHESPEHSRFDEIYRQQFSQPQRPGASSSSSSSGCSSRPSNSCSAPTSTSSGSGQGSPVHHGSPQRPEPQQQLAVDFSKRESAGDDSDQDTVSAPKRSYMAWDHERRTASSGSSSCESIMGDDPINLTTCKSRSRSSSENEDDLNNRVVSSQSHHMPHKMRYKYLQHQENPGEKEEY